MNEPTAEEVATLEYKEWSKKVRADAREHCSSIWLTRYGNTAMTENISYYKKER